MNGLVLQRRDVVRRLLAPRGPRTLVVGGIGSPSWDIAATADDAKDFCLVGGMGLAVSVALGLAVARTEDRILAITGDGDMLMGMGSLATVARFNPGNLAIVVLDNECFGETGGQPTHTAGATDLAAIAAGAGIPASATIRNETELNAMVDAAHNAVGPLFFAVKIDQAMPETVLPPLDGAFVKDRFRAAVLGSA